MGREIRRVPPDWVHPTYEDQAKKHGGRYHPHPEWPHPLYDKSYDEACTEWKQEYADWEANKDGCQDKAIELMGHPVEYWDWNGMPPNAAFYRDRAWSVEEATAYQIYETVSEGTPKSPVCATRNELRDWLVAHQNMTPSTANAFIDQEWAMSGMIYPDQGVVLSNYQQFDVDAKPFERE